MTSYVKVRAPASIANLGCLFDAAAMAVEAFRDSVVVEEASGGLRVEAVGGAPGGRSDVAYEAARLFLERFYGKARGIRIVVEKGVPIAAGLGSSGATAAATVVALNELLGAGVDAGELIEVAGRAEVVAAGSPHYDNVAASVLGGIVLVDPADPKSHIILHPPEWLRVVVFLRRAGVKGKTRLMRRVIPRDIGLQEASRLAFSAAMLALGITRGLKHCVKYASYGGPVEEARGRLLESYWRAKEAALRAGALAFNIAGAGPSLFALVEEGREEEVINAVMSVAEGYEPIVSRVSIKGAVHDVESRR